MLCSCSSFSISVLDSSKLLLCINRGRFSYSESNAVGDVLIWNVKLRVKLCEYSIIAAEIFQQKILPPASLYLSHLLLNYVAISMRPEYEVEYQPWGKPSLALHLHVPITAHSKRQILFLISTSSHIVIFGLSAIPWLDILAFNGTHNCLFRNATESVRGGKNIYIPLA